MRKTATTRQARLIGGVILLLLSIGILGFVGVTLIRGTSPVPSSGASVRLSQTPFQPGESPLVSASAAPSGRGTPLTQIHSPAPGQTGPRPPKATPTLHPTQPGQTGPPPPSGGSPTATPASSGH